VLKGFKAFLLRGNVVDLAVAVVLGAAFGAIVSAFATDFIGGLIAAVGGVPAVDDAGITVREATATEPATKVVYGTTLTAIINFLIVSAIVYFVVVVPMRVVAERRAAAVEDPAPLTDEAQLLTEIRDLLREQRG